VQVISVKAFKAAVGKRCPGFSSAMGREVTPDFCWIILTSCGHGLALTWSFLEASPGDLDG
jgi:hypothetical protein